MDFVKPIILTDNETGEKYTLEFDRESAIFTNRMGFKNSEFYDNMEEMLPILFFGAFRKHHKKMSRAQTDKIIEKLQADNDAAFSDAFVARLIELYAQPRNTLYGDADYSKNSLMTVEGLD